LVGEDKLTRVANNFLELVGTCVTIHEKNGDYALRIISSDYCRFLDEASRRLCDTDDNRKALESGTWHCHESCWTEASGPCIATGKPIDIECRGGIRIYAVPIWVEGEIAGSMSFGYGNPPEDLKKLKEISERYSVSANELQKRVNRRQTASPLLVNVAKNYLETCAMLIGTLAERKKREKALRDSEEKFRLIFENTKDGIIWVAPGTGLIINCNKAAETLLGRTRAEIIGHQQATIHPHEKAEYYTRMLKAFAAHDEDTCQAEVTTKSGETKTVNVIASTIAIGDESIIQEIFEDRTELMQMEGALRHYSSHLEELAKQRSEKLLEAERVAAIEEMARVVSYDLQNSLRIIMRSVSLAREKMDSVPRPIRSYVKKAGAWEIVGNIEEQVDYMNKIVSDLHDYTRPLEPKLVKTEFRQLIENTLSTAKVPETVQVSTTIEDGFPKLMLDAKMMQQVFADLITNAIEAMPKGGKIVIEASKKENVAYIRMRDTGVGIPKDILNKIFLPLFSTKPGGTGFGLPVCKRLVEIHGGSIVANSAPDKGSTFTVKLPLKRDSRLDGTKIRM
jgi:PAS domain S-box-containing protein